MKKNSLIRLLAVVLTVTVVLAVSGVFSYEKNYEKANFYLGSGENEKAAFYYIWSTVLDSGNPSACAGALVAMEDNRDSFIYHYIIVKAEKNKVKTILPNRILLHKDIKNYNITDCIIDGVSVKMYNSQGQLIQKGHLYTGAYGKWTPLELYKYHPNGRVAEDTRFNSGNGYKMQKCTYSDAGHILTKTVYKTGSEDMDRQYVYNEKGLVVKETEFGKTNKNIYYSYNSKDQLCTENHDNEYKKEYTYDEQGRNTKITTIRLADGEITSVINLEYGDIQSDTVTMSTEEKYWKIINTYYIDGKIAKIETLNKSNVSLVDNTEKIVPNKIEYFDNGKLIKEENYAHWNGRLTDIIYYNNGVKYREEKYEKSADGIFLKNMYLYDSKGRVTEHHLYSTADKIETVEKYSYGFIVEKYEKYNSLGNLVYRTVKDSRDYSFKEQFFANASPNYELYSTIKDTRLNKAVVNFPKADMTGSRYLTKEETQQVNSDLKLKDFYQTHPLECLLSIASGYGRPQEINLASFVESLATHGKRTDKANIFGISVLDMDCINEIASLKRSGVQLWYDNLETGEDIYYRIKYSAVESLLKKYMNISTKDIENPQMPVKSDAYGCYYAGETNQDYTSFICIGGEINDKWLKLYSENRTRIFRIDNGRYYLYAFISERNTDKPQIYIEETEYTPRPAETVAPDDISIDTLGKSTAYKNAEAKFVDFLKGEADKLSTQIRSGYTLRYTLVDLSRDGIPELITHPNDAFAPYDVYMTIDGKVQHIYTTDAYGGDGGSTVLSSGYIMGRMHKTDYKAYDFYRFRNDGSIVEFHFGTDQDYFRDDVKYQINGEYVPRREYIAKTRSYNRLRNNEAQDTVQWHYIQIEPK